MPVPWPVLVAKIYIKGLPVRELTRKITTFTTATVFMQVKQLIASQLKFGLVNKVAEFRQIWSH